MVDPVAAYDPGAPGLHREIPDNLALDWEIGDAIDIRRWAFDVGL